eukprot:973918-Pleurochrysis_carterae.AAC.1
MASRGQRATISHHVLIGEISMLPLSRVVSQREADAASRSDLGWCIALKHSARMGTFDLSAKHRMTVDRYSSHRPYCLNAG